MGLSYEVPLRSMYSTGAPRAGSSAADQQTPVDTGGFILEAVETIAAVQKCAGQGLAPFQAFTAAREGKLHGNESAEQTWWKGVTHIQMRRQLIRAL